MTKYKYIALTIAFLASLTAYAAPKGESQENTLSQLENDPSLITLVESYTPWHSVEFSGKLRLDKLPLSPTIKIYMVRDSLIQLSARAPFVGEVARLNLTKDELLVVNKLNKTYCQEDPAVVLSKYPDALADIQNLLLARPVIIGEGEVTWQNASEASYLQQEDGTLVILDNFEPMSVQYGYVLNQAARIQSALFEKGSDQCVALQYAFPGAGETISVSIEKNGKVQQGELDFTSVKWGGKEMGMPRVAGYQLMSAKEMIKKLK